MAGGCSKTVNKLHEKTARLIQHIALFTDIRPSEQKSAYIVLSRLCKRLCNLLKGFSTP